MKFESVAVIVVGSILLGVLGGFAARSIWVGIGLPIVLIIFGLLWLAIKSGEKPKEEEEKKDEETTQDKEE